MSYLIVKKELVINIDKTMSHCKLFKDSSPTKVGYFQCVMKIDIPDCDSVFPDIYDVPRRLCKVNAIKKFIVIISHIKSWDIRHKYYTFAFAYFLVLLTQLTHSTYI